MGETVRYDDKTPRRFFLAAVVWAVVGMLVGVLIAALLFIPALNFAPYLTFGRLRPLHTNAVIFAFCGNIIFAGTYHSMQRLLKTRLFSDGLSAFHFWGWQLLIVAAAVALVTGNTQGKEYAELPWILDIVIAVLWVTFAINFFGTIAIRREQHLYVAIWFYIATIVAVAILHIGNSMVLPYSWLGSYSAYAGVKDALMQWWYGHNAVAFFLTTPFLGLMYYYLPKAAERPVFSYRLSIMHFWSLVFVYIWAGPHHLHYSAIPEWASTLGMLFSLVLWMPSWGGMVNGFFTLRGAWHKLREDPILKFMVVAITYYGMSTFEGPMMSIKSVNAVSHFTDWTIGHVHAGALGWNAFLSFAILYWAIPRLWKTQLYSTRLATAHFWTSTVGLITYQVSMWVAGLTQWAMWRAFEPDGRLTYPDFIETVVRIIPMYWVRLGGGLLFFAGLLMMCWNIFKTIKTAPADYAVEPEVHAPPRVNDDAAPGAVTPANTYDYALYRLQHATRHGFHRVLERRTVTFTVLTVLALSVGSLVEGLPMFFNKSNVKEIASVKPYTPLEVVGRDIYVREGCYNCHSQLVRPFRYETERYGEYSKAGEYIYDRPFQWGSKRTGPDLHRVGGKYPSLWHVRHMDRPDSTTPGSIMPRYPHLLTRTFDTSLIRRKLEVLRTLGAPYTDGELENAITAMQAQAGAIAAEVESQQGPKGLADKEILALTAYLQRLGTDIRWKRVETQAPFSAPSLITPPPSGGGR
ncbi:MAG TPA: cytochrome-c oxidase, cbb3-type subunit I [Vicinamibacterales bacterium]|nr:cytochrome-c oxidase, cbb3-type subunit I [Acidobacteriota bacterium]HQX82242.1 cytochrome-c oxidase, cbb3-type subunit I [Vicinamibacterales bacterium]